MLNIIRAKLNSKFGVFDALVNQITAEQLHEAIDLPKYKTIADHLWCTVGARQSYSRALEAGQWQGFSCSLDENASLEDFRQALITSAEACEQAINAITLWEENRRTLVIDLLEHETVHEAQLIRLCYALEMPFPEQSQWS